MNSQSFRGSVMWSHLSHSVPRFCLRQSCGGGRQGSVLYLPLLTVYWLLYVLTFVIHRIWKYFGHCVLNNLPPFSFFLLCIYVPTWRHLMNSWALVTAIFHCVHMIENFSCLPSNSLILIPAQIFKSCHLRVCLVPFLSWLWWNIDRKRLTF